MTEPISHSARLADLGHDLEDVDQHAAEIAAIVRHEGHNLVGVVQATQRAFGYVPANVLQRLAAQLEVPLARLYGVATFYGSLRLHPRGRSVVRVCDGTACHVRGARRLTDALVERLGIGPGETTSDQAFTLETAACFGCCSLAPVALVGEEVAGRLTRERVIEWVDALAEGRELR